MATAGRVKRPYGQVAARPTDVHDKPATTNKAKHDTCRMHIPPMRIGTILPVLDLDVQSRVRHRQIVVGALLGLFGSWHVGPDWFAWLVLLDVSRVVMLYRPRSTMRQPRHLYFIQVVQHDEAELTCAG